MPVKASSRPNLGVGLSRVCRLGLHLDQAERGVGRVCRLRLRPDQTWGSSRQGMPIKASSRPSRVVAEELCQYFDENASLKPPWLGEEKVCDFISFSCSRT